MKIKNIFVMGAGAMGNGITQVSVQAGYNVTMMDIKEDFIKRGLDSIEKSLSRIAKKGGISEKEKARILSSINTTTDINEAKDADLVIEAIPEVLELKLNAFEKLDRICPQHTILASNTSALPISAMAAATKRQPKVIGTHFMNPVPVMKGVEIIRARHTSNETLQTTKDYVKSLGKEPCEAADYAGFTASRVLDIMLNEAVNCVMEGNKPEEIDKTMKLCCNLPMGPLELLDLTGLDIICHSLETMHKELGERFRPSPLLVSMVRAGDLGRKTGRGFHNYTKEGSK